MRTLHLASAALLMLSACAVSAGDEEEAGRDSGDLSGSESYQSDGKSDAAFDQTSAELTAKYGLRPRRYNGFFNDSNTAETRFRAALPTLTATMNARAATNGVAFRFTAQELATNFITEGGYYMLDADIHDSSGEYGQIDAFSYLGCDTIVDNLSSVRPWLSTQLQTLIADPAHQITRTNELGQEVHSVYVDTIEQGMELNAAMFAWSRSLAAREMTKYGKHMESVAAEARFFWTTIWFNAGAGFGQRQMASHGVDYWKTKWTSGDDPSMSRYARYNALWRTSSWDFMTRTLPMP